MAREGLPITNRQVVQTRLHLARSFGLMLHRVNIRSMSSRGRLENEQESIERKKNSTQRRERGYLLRFRIWLYFVFERGGGAGGWRG
jgi:hypothetical protein